MSFLFVPLGHLTNANHQDMSALKEVKRKDNIHNHSRKGKVA